MTNFFRSAVDNQADRATTYGNCMRQWVACPFMIGAQWYGYINMFGYEPDPTVHNAWRINFGFVDNRDVPYSDFVTGVSQVNARIKRAERNVDWQYAH